MSDRANMASQFYIDDHAVLYGLLLKQADTLCGSKGEDASVKATIQYARERGLRMAMRCLADGKALTPRNYLDYGEWIDDRQWSTLQVASLEPFTLHAVGCGWNNSWRKHGLEKYGKVYCTWIDKELVRAFNPENELVLGSALSFGDDKCDLRFNGARYTDEADLKAAGAEKALLRGRVVKDFLYHTGHILSALRRTYLVELGLVRATAIVDKALEEYAAIFGSDKAAAVVAESRQDYLTV